MTAPLSQDLRQQIVRAVSQGSSIRQAAKRFEVSPSAAIKLMRRVRQTSSMAVPDRPAWLGRQRIGTGGRTPGVEFAVSGSVNAALLSLTKALADKDVNYGVQVMAVIPARSAPSG